MLPDDILRLIDTYVRELDAYTDLPNMSSVKRLIKKVDSFVLSELGLILGMPHQELRRLRYRIELDDDFVFYFHMDARQRILLYTKLETAIHHNLWVSTMVWIFVVRTPHLVLYPDYQEAFRHSLFCKLLEYLKS